MSTRCNIIIQSENTKLFFYRHSDGYPEVTGESLKNFCKGYSKHLRDNPNQSAGWLIIQGREEYQDIINSPGYNWKVGAYEPTDTIHGDIEYLYTIDLDEKKLICQTHNGTKAGKTIFSLPFSELEKTQPKKQRNIL